MQKKEDGHQGKDVSEQVDTPSYAIIFAATPPAEDV